MQLEIFWARRSGTPVANRSTCRTGADSARKMNLNLTRSPRRRRCGRMGAAAVSRRHYSTQVVAILGHFPVMLLLLMLPQLVNFVVSIPQLFKLRPCPRHRLPTYDERTGLLRCSYVNDRATIVPKDGMNLTLINLVLRVKPMTEPALASTLLLLQALCCALALFLRFGWAGGIY